MPRIREAHDCAAFRFPAFSPPMHRLARVLRPLALTLLLTAAAHAGDPDSVAIYTGVERFSSTGGGNTPSREGSASGRRRQTVYIAINLEDGMVQRVVIKHSTRKFVVEPPVAFDQIFAKNGASRPREYVRLMLVNHNVPGPGQFTNTSSIYDGRALDTVINSAGLTRAYPRVLTWDFDFQNSGFLATPPDVTTYPQLDTGRATLSLNKALTKGAVGKTLDDSIDVITGALIARHYSEEM
jgi:hypothetical protein